MNMKTARPIRFVCVVIPLAAAIGAVPAAAQMSSAAVAGIVRDASGNALPHRRLRLENVETGEVRRTISGEAGEFEFAGLLPARRFILDVEADGLRAAQRAIDAVAAGERRLVDLQLAIAGVSAR